MSIAAFLDASVLYPATLRSVLMYLAAADVFRALWSDAVSKEWMAALMEAHVEHAVVSGYEERMPTLTLPDPEDRHLLAAAIHGGADIIVTANLGTSRPRLSNPTRSWRNSRMPSCAASLRPMRRQR